MQDARSRMISARRFRFEVHRRTPLFEVFFNMRNNRNSSTETDASNSYVCDYIEASHLEFSNFDELHIVRLASMYSGKGAFDDIMKVQRFGCVLCLRTEIRMRSAWHLASCILHPVSCILYPDYL